MRISVSTSRSRSAFVLVFGVLVAIDVSVAAGCVRNHASAHRLFLLVGTAVPTSVTLGLVQIRRAIYRRIEQLEDL